MRAEVEGISCVTACEWRTISSQMSASVYLPPSNDLFYLQKKGLIKSRQAVAAKNEPGLKVLLL